MLLAHSQLMPPSPLAAAAYGLFVVAATAAAAWVDATLAVTIGALGAAIAVSATGVGALISRRRSVDKVVGAFRTMCAENDDMAAALTDLDGRIEAMNGKAVSVAGDGCADIGALISCYADHGPEIAYRILRRLRDAGSALERRQNDGDRAFFYARRLRDSHLVWWVGETPTIISDASDGDRSMAAGRLIDALPLPVARLSVEGDILALNAAARQLLGGEARLGRNIGAVVEGMGARPIGVRLDDAARGRGSGRMEIARARREGPETFLQLGLSRLDEEDGTSLMAVMADATELKTLEAQFVQSQKMQAVGQLAGGVAHDFNNLLTAISGHADLMLHRRSTEDQDYADLSQIRQNVNRAAGLVRQLLAFSRKQTLRPSTVSLSDSLTEVSHLLNRLLGEKVVLRIEHGHDLHLVKVDERQFEQVIMNLVVNARDAMPQGGTVTLRTSNESVETDRHIGRAMIPRGDYVRIDVIDQGMGIPEDKLDAIFEPFFTTKRQGEGTGLGLSTVYGIVKQTGGFIFVESAVGRGSTFTIYLPRHDAPVEAPEIRRRETASRDLTGSGAVLLIEDEAPVRAFAMRALKLRGYEVTEAASAEEALELLEDAAFRVDLIVSDVVMPGMDGPSCVREARQTRPDVAVVFMSGYAEDALKRGMDDLENCHFLAKPFSLNQLTLTVKEAMSG